MTNRPYFECTKVGLEFLHRNTSVIKAEVIVRATPEQIFEVFEDPHAWTVWALPIQKVEWTSPKPFGVGTTRTVSMMGDLVGYEEFIAWERGKRMAFTFVGCSQNTVESFLEDYRVTDLGDGRCRAEWYMALATRGLSAKMMWLTRPLMRLANRWMFGRFKRYVEAHAASARVLSPITTSVKERVPVFQSRTRARNTVTHSHRPLVVHDTIREPATQST